MWIKLVQNIFSEIKFLGDTNSIFSQQLNIIPIQFPPVSPFPLNKIFQKQTDMYFLKETTFLWNLKSARLFIKMHAQKRKHNSVYSLFYNKITKTNIIPVKIHLYINLRFQRQYWNFEVTKLEI